MIKEFEHVFGDKQYVILDGIIGMGSLPPKKVDIIVTDPPFAIDFKAKRSNYNRKQESVLEGYVEIPKDKYYDFTESWLGQARWVLKDTGSMFIFSGWTNLRDILNAIHDCGLHVMNHLIWKYQFGVFTRRKFVTSHYHLLFVVKNPRKYKFNKIEHYPEDVWVIKREYWRGKKKTPTKLPTEIVKKILGFGTDPGDIVLDPFLGSGTVVKVANEMGRHGYGFEINPEFEEMIKEGLYGDK